MVEAAVGVEPGDRLAERGLETLEVLVRLRKLAAGVAEEVLHLRDLAAHVDRERGAVLATRDAHDMACRFRGRVVGRAASTAGYRASRAFRCGVVAYNMNSFIMPGACDSSCEQSQEGFAAACAEQLSELPPGPARAVSAS